MNDMPADATNEEIEIAEELIHRILDLFDLTGNVEIRRRDEGTILDIQGCTNSGRLIGEEGSTLFAIQVLSTLIICRKTRTPTNLRIDVNGYRARRRKQLEDMAWRACDKVLDTGRSYTMRQMNAADRRIIHMTLSEEPDIETYSVDEDPDSGMKCVMISLAEYDDDDDYCDDEERDYTENEEPVEDEGEQ